MKLRKPARRPSKEAGFTLTEIMVVVFIIGLLSTVVLINVLGARTDAQLKTARTNVTSLANALEQYSLDMYDYPTTEQGLEALVTEPPGASTAGSYRKGGYINKVPLDPWGRPFVYRRPAERSDKAYDLYSLGADGEPGGEEENADIGNWN
ncbi:type II secretion system major pseudopilin GspG [Henriciella mobilis]|uniref:Type II secretion system core protein G n=1 Tax=Henriciella mobilis TaxID=2305467 RepID=A0A399RA55_9PROT|nr:type II secretion system major pseudopilin GspG [Henriciella mobilis]RIJ28288.1 type II secretion system protein GspG [Henriciella mobilis]